MIWHWPQYVIAAKMALSLICQIGLHGTARSGKYDGLAALFAIGGWATVLYFGGFWGIQP